MKKYSSLCVLLLVFLFVSGCTRPSPNGGATSSGGNNFTSALTSGTGLRGFVDGLALNSISAKGISIAATQNSNGSYTLNKTFQEYINSTWGASQPLPLNNSLTILNAAGNWVAAPSQSGLTNGSIYTANTDDTITVNDLLYGNNITYKPVAIDIGGVSFLGGTTYGGVYISQMSNIDSNGIFAPLANITGGASFSAGSIDWILVNGISTQDAYSLINWYVATVAGSLTQLVSSQVTSFTLTNPLCAFGVSLVYASQPAGVTPSTYRFDVYPQASPDTCSVVTPSATGRHGTLDMTYSTARGSNLVLVPSNFAPNPAFTSVVNPIAANVIGAQPVLALYNSFVYTARFLPSGSRLDGATSNFFNKTAMNSYLSAAGAIGF